MNVTPTGVFKFKSPSEYSSHVPLSNSGSQRSRQEWRPSRSISPGTASLVPQVEAVWSGFYWRFKSISPEPWRGLSTFRPTCRLQTRSSVSVATAVGKWWPRRLSHRQATNAPHEVRLETGQRGTTKPNTEATVRGDQMPLDTLLPACLEGQLQKARSTPVVLILMEMPIKTSEHPACGPSALPWGRKRGCEPLGSWEGGGRCRGRVPASGQAARK